MTETASPATPEVKRGRGRPRKEESVAAKTDSLAEPKRGRGRPRKEPVAQAPQESVQPKRGRGRPPKVVSETPKIEASEKRGRGRPPKAAPLSQVGESKPLFGLISNSAPDAGDQKRGRGRPRHETAPDVASALEAPTLEELISIELLPGESVPMPLFRTASSTRTVSTRPDSTFEATTISAEASDPRSNRRNDRRRRGRDRDREPMVAEASIVPSESAEEPVKGVRMRSRRDRAEDVATPKISAPEPPAPPVREFVRVPSDAPQVFLRDGIPTLVRDGRVFPPLFFFGNASDESRLETVLEEIKYAAEAGVGVIVHYIEIEVNREGDANDAVQFAGYLLNQTIAVAPEAQVIFRTVFTAASGWESTYRQAKYVAESGGLGDPSVCDDMYWGDAEHCLEDFVAKLRLLPNSNHVMGVHLERGEWFFAAGWGYDTSPAAQSAFRDWVRMRYRNDNVALCASWFDGQAQFETLTVPEYRGEVRSGEEFVRTGRKARRWVDYHLFLSDITVERIGKLAHVAKKASDGYFLVGVSYGYTFEWSHPASGHLSLGKLLRNPEVDFIAGPPSYKNREPGGSCPFPGPIDSYALNGKLYISEEDFKTPITAKHEADDFNPVMKTPQSLETVHWRGLGAAAAHGGGVCWMDLWGNGWLKSPGIWERAAQVRDALINRMAVPLGDPDVAVFVDERSLAYLVDQKAFTLLVQNVREAILRSGLSAGFYLLSDLAHREQFPEAKVNVFLNAWDIRPEVRSAIKSRLQRDDKVLFWMYAAGLFDAGRDALERVREVTGIALKRQPFASRSGTSIVHKKHPLCESLPEKMLSSGGELEPSYFAIPEDGVVLGEYTATGLPSFVMREFKGDAPGQSWKSVFLGEPVVTPGFFRALGQLAGAHVWNFQEDLVHARLPFVTLHCNGSGSRTLALPDKASAYSLQRSEWVPLEGAQFRFSAIDGQSQSFLIGLKSEIELILKTPVEQLLHVDALPERPENTVHLDDIHFDVPIMKVDAWVEEGWSEEMATDLVFKPSVMEEQATESEENSDNEPFDRGNRRQGRRRRGRKPDGDSKRPRQPASDFDISEMNIVFRKRD